MCYALSCVFYRAHCAFRGYKSHATHIRTLSFIPSLARARFHTYRGMHEQSAPSTIMEEEKIHTPYKSPISTGCADTSEHTSCPCPVCERDGGGLLCCVRACVCDGVRALSAHGWAHVLQDGKYSFTQTFNHILRPDF